MLTDFDLDGNDRRKPLRSRRLTVKLVEKNAAEEEILIRLAIFSRSNWPTAGQEVEEISARGIHVDFKIFAHLLDSQVVDGRLTIGVEILKSPDLNTLQPTPMPIELPESTLVAEVLNWIRSEDFGDVDIYASDGQKFRAHKDVLSRRSEVFSLMFNAGMSEAQRNRVDMVDSTAEVVAALLAFFYADNVGDINGCAAGLYAAADKYQLDRLKRICEAPLLTRLDVKSIVESVGLACRYGIDRLLAGCQEFLQANKRQLPWADLFLLTGEFPQLAPIYAEVMEN